MLFRSPSGRWRRPQASPCAECRGGRHGDPRFLERGAPSRRSGSSRREPTGRLRRAPLTHTVWDPRTTSMILWLGVCGRSGVHSCSSAGRTGWVSIRMTLAVRDVEARMENRMIARIPLGRTVPGRPNVILTDIRPARGPQPHAPHTAEVRGREHRPRPLPGNRLSRGIGRRGPSDGGAGARCGRAPARAGT